VLTHTAATHSTDLTSVTPVLPRHILLVEDDAVIRDLVVEVLEDAGYTVTASVTPMEATRLLDQVGFDLVITDGFSTLPSSSFASTADVVRSAGPIPVALFSAHTHDLDVAKAAGFRDLIAKPFDLDTLVHQVKVLLGQLPRHAAPAHSSGGVPCPFLAESA
jgi:CheY-like chemotaxis protein